MLEAWSMQIGPIIFNQSVKTVYVLFIKRSSDPSCVSECNSHIHIGAGSVCEMVNLQMNDGGHLNMD